MLFFSLAIVIGLIFLTYWVTQKLGLPTLNAGNSKNFKVIDRMVLGREKYLAVVQLQEKYYLIGVSDQQISLLKELGDDFSFSDPAEAPAQFGAILQNIFKHEGSKK